MPSQRRRSYQDDRQTDKHTGRQAGRQTGRQADGRTDRRTDGQTDGQTVREKEIDRRKGSNLMYLVQCLKRKTNQIECLLMCFFVSTSV